MDAKQCSKCRRWLPVTMFSKASINKDGLRGHCKDCIKKYNAQPESVARRAKYQRTPAGRLAQKRCRIKHLYGISLEEYDQRWQEQHGCCALCGDFHELLFVDHDHRCCPGIRSCGKCLRKMLCDNCNRGIGCFKDNPKVLRLAADYVEVG